MRRNALTKLRVGFVLLFVAVLVPLALLLRDVRARLEAQQALRHRIVAERIFDEMERELTEQLTREGERPSSAYDALETQTHVSSWAPFVVGYFTRDAAGLRVIARDQLGPERARRVEDAVRAATGAAPASNVESSAPTPDAQPIAAEKSRPAPKSARKQAIPPAMKDSASVLRQLNRATEERDELEKKAVRRAPAPSGSKAEDPLQGL